MRTMLLCLGLGCVVLAAARPQWGTRLETIAREGLDVVIVLDEEYSLHSPESSSLWDRPGCLMTRASAM